MPIRWSALVAFGEDEFVLERMFEADEFGHADLVAMGFEK